MITLSKLGDVELSAVMNETPTFPNEITDKPVENGQNVADHIRNQPITLTVEGVVTGPDAADKLQKLRTYRNEGALLQYLGRNILGNCVIQELQTSHDYSIRNGFKFTLRLREIRLAQVQVAMIERPSSPAVATQSSGVGNKGRQQANGGATEERKRSTLLKIGQGAGDYLEKVMG